MIKLLLFANVIRFVNQRLQKSTASLRKLYNVKFTANPQEIEIFVLSQNTSGSAIADNRATLCVTDNVL